MYKLLMSILLLGLVSCSQTSHSDEVLITGKVIGNNDYEVIHTVPVNSCYGIATDVILPDSVGSFELKLEIEEPTFLSFCLRGNNQHLLVCPGENYEVKINTNDSPTSWSIVGENALLQAAYQKFLSPFDPTDVAMQYMNGTYADAQKAFDSDSAREMDEFKASVGESISPKIMALVQYDRKLYYCSIKCKLLVYKCFQAYRTNNKEELNTLVQTGLNLFKDIDFEDTDFLRSKWSYPLLRDFLFLKQYETIETTTEAQKKAKIEGLRHTFKINFAKQYLSETNFEFYTAHYLKNALRQRKYEKELLTLFDDFKAQFPNSNYTQYLISDMDKVNDFHRIAAMEFPEDIKVLDNYQTIGSLSECMQAFKGQKVYVDIWGTLCGYCKDEFAYKDAIDSVLKEMNVTMLYISTDGDQNEERWLNMIKYYDLSGYHIRANKDLKADMDNILNLKGIPRYVLFDENGKIINDDMPRPSQAEEVRKILADD